MNELTGKRAREAPVLDVEATYLDDEAIIATVILGDVTDIGPKAAVANIQQLVSILHIVVLLAGPEKGKFLILLKPKMMLVGVIAFRRAVFTKTPGFILIIESIAATQSVCLLYTSPSPRDKRQSRMPSSA